MMRHAAAAGRRPPESDLMTDDEHGIEWNDRLQVLSKVVPSELPARRQGAPEKREKIDRQDCRVIEESIR